MRIFIFVCIFFIKVFSWAHEYHYVSSSRYSFMDIHEVTEALKDANLVEIDPKKEGKVLSYFADQVYIDPYKNSERLAILKLDIYYSQNTKLLNLGFEEYVCHASTARQRNFALYVKGFSRQEAHRLCSQFKNSKPQSFSKTELLQRFFQNSANAQSFGQETDCQCTPNPINKTVEELSSALASSEAAQKLGMCISASFQGAVGSVTGLADSLRGAYSALLKTPKELWDEVRKQATALKNFVLHLKNEVLQLKQALSDMDNDLLLDLGCHVAGEFVASMGLSALTGAGLLKLSTQMMQLIEKLKNSKSLLSRLTSLSKNGKKDLAKEVMSCAVK